MENLFYEEPKPENRYDLFRDDKPFQKKKLKRSNTDRIFFGICGGISNRVGIASVLIRLLFMVAVLFGGLGALLYALLILILHKEKVKHEDETKRKISPKNTKSLLGITLLFGGLYYSFMPKDYFPFLFFIQIPIEVIAACLFLGFGIWFHINYSQKSSSGSSVKLVRPRRGRLFLGVCIGISTYLGTYSIIVRLLFIVFSFMTLGLGIILYFLIALFSETELRWEVEK